MVLNFSYFGPRSKLNPLPTELEIVVALKNISVFFIAGTTIVIIAGTTIVISGKINLIMLHLNWFF